MKPFFLAYALLLPSSSRSFWKASSYIRLGTVWWRWFFLSQPEVSFFGELFEEMLLGRFSASQRTRGYFRKQSPKIRRIYWKNLPFSKSLVWVSGNDGRRQVGKYRFISPQNKRVNLTRALSWCLQILFSVCNTKGQRTTKEFKEVSE